MKILIAFDDSPYSQTVINEIVKQHWQKNTEFKVTMILEQLCVVPDDIDDPDTEEAIAKVYKKRWHLAKTMCESVVHKLKASFPGCKADFEIKEGSARKEIINVAVTWNADKIILGAHGMDICPRNILGSVSTYVAAHAPCSVEILRTKSAA